MPEGSLIIDIEIEKNPIQQKGHPSQKINVDHSIDFSKLHSDIISSWRDAFRYKREIPEYEFKGLRPPQLGAIHSIQAHCIASKEPATIVLPTGTGKTETMLSVMIAQSCRRILLIQP